MRVTAGKPVTPNEANILAEQDTKRVRPEIRIGAVRVVASSLLATKEVEWLTAFRVVRRRWVLYLVAAPGLVPLNLPENEELRCLCLLLESRAIKLPQ